VKIRYLSKPQALNIEPEGGLGRTDGVKFVLRSLMGLSISLRQIVYGDDMLETMLPFSQEGSLLMCPSNAQESVKKLVLEKGGFVSEKRSTEAVAEFLTEVYPRKYQDKHQAIHSIFFDMDGVVWEEERVNQNLPFLSIIADYIKNCEGPYTAHPPISNATGAYRKNLMRMVGDIRLTKQNIPVRLHRKELPLSWPPIVFEGGYLVFDPVNATTYDLTEEQYGLVSPVYRELISLIMALGKRINERVPEINKTLGAECRIAPKERQGYNLDLPLEVRRAGPEEIRKAHTLIYQSIRDLLEKYIPSEVEIEFGGLLSRKELERREKS